MNIRYFLFFFFFLVVTLNINLISSTNLEIGYDDSSVPRVEIEVPETPVNYTLKDTNSSEYWDNLDTINTTQMEDNGGVLNILESWLTTFLNAWFLTKDVNNLSETPNKYVNVDGDTMTGNLIMNNANITDTGTTRMFFENGALVIQGGTE